MTIGTRLFTYFRGREVGRDAAGNRYFEERAKKPGNLRQRRWVLYAGGAEEATLVPPAWHAWLHYTTDAPLPEAANRPWQKPHQPNRTGTPLSYRPPGHDYSGGKRARATGDYESWSPDLPPAPALAHAAPALASPPMPPGGEPPPAPHAAAGA